MTFPQLLSSLIANPDRPVIIRNKQKNIAGFAEFRSINLGDNGYFKVTFDDHSFLFLVPSEGLLLYTDEAPTPFIEIADEEIGTVQELTYRGKQYLLENGNDYQYVVRLIKGDYRTIEGEVKFSDYVPKDGGEELLSLGWIVKTGERADVNPKGISLKEIQLI